MVVKELKQTLPCVYELTPDAGSAFFLRTEYLTLVKPERFEDFLMQPSSFVMEFTEEEWIDILNAALSYSAEVLAMGYLARAEQYKNGLKQKLLKKGLEKQSVENALDYLETAGYLSDRRFAGAWLRTRSIDHAEGRIRLAAELAARGVDKAAAKDALDEFFSEHEEADICRRAYKKLSKFKKDEKKLHDALCRAGFSEKLIRSVMNV